MKSSAKNKPSAVEFRLLAFLAVVPWIALGCGSISPARMVPEALPQPAVKVDGSVRVMEVTGGKESFFSPDSLESLLPNNDLNNYQFRKALVLALDKSGLFSGVSSDHGDLDLYATIISEGQRGTTEFTKEYTATLLVSYKFVDRASNVVWSASYGSESSSRNFFAGTRILNAREGSARENLSSLIQGIMETWPRK